MSATAGQVTLLTSDNHTVIVDKDLLACSKVLSGDYEDPNQAIPLPNVTIQELNKVLEYMEHHRGQYTSEEEAPQQPRKSRVPMRARFDEWDCNYIDSLDTTALFNIILVANYLDIKPLLDLGCSQVASNMIGKTPAEIQQVFGIASGPAAAGSHGA